jgi:hypothetical protein
MPNSTKKLGATEFLPKFISVLFFQSSNRAEVVAAVDGTTLCKGVKYRKEVGEIE